MGGDVRRLALGRLEILLEGNAFEAPTFQVRDRNTLEDSRTRIQAHKICQDSEPDKPMRGTSGFRPVKLHLRIAPG